MQLREYRKEDATTICKWIKDEKSLYQWSADRIGIFPLEPNDLNDHFEKVKVCDRITPFTAIDQDGKVIGHFFIRYPNKTDTSFVRFGYVIVDSDCRGMGYGKKMLQLAIDYVKNELKATRITLGVFNNNPSAKHCYEAVGFKTVGDEEVYKMSIGEWGCTEMELILKE